MDREVIGSEILWEKGHPCRVIREDGGRSKHEPVPRWTTNRTLAKHLAGKVGPLYLLPDEPPDAVCLKVLIRYLQTRGGLWRKED